MIFESDCTIIVEAFNKPTLNRSEQNYRVTVLKIHKNYNMVACGIYQFSRMKLCMGVFFFKNTPRQIYQSYRKDNTEERQSATNKM
jgi:hypothetical protein